MRVALMFNSGNCSLKSLEVKATQNDFDTLKFTSTSYAVTMTYMYIQQILECKCA